MKITYTLQFSDKRDNACDDMPMQATSPAEAIAEADKTARGWAGHPDYVGGRFQVNAIEGDSCQIIHTTATVPSSR